MVYKVRRAKEITRDLDLIEDYLVQTYQGFGDDVEQAMVKALDRVREAQAYIRSFTTHPHRGTEHPDVRTGLRTVTSNRFVYYFEIDEPLSEVRVLAVFFGGVDHQRQLLDRLTHSFHRATPPTRGDKAYCVLGASDGRGRQAGSLNVEFSPRPRWTRRICWD